MSHKYTKLWMMWQKYKQVSTEKLSEIINKKFTTLSEGVCVQIAADAVRFSRLGDRDEAIYVHLVRLRGVYRRVVALAGEYTFEDPTVCVLIDGICDVLNYRLREFEGESETGDGSSPPATNPITLEKRAIIAEALTNASALMKKLKQNFVTGLREEDSQEWDESFELILCGDFHEMYTYYREGLRFCKTRLDDLHSRKTAQFYTELIEREREELGNIIKAHVLALEDTCAAATAAAHKDGVSVPLKSDTSPVEMMGTQMAAIASISDALKEAYQQTGLLIETLQSILFTPPKKQLSCRPFEEFEIELLAALEGASSPLPQRKSFFDALDTEVMVLFGGTGVEYKKAAYKLQRIFSADVLLAEEMLSVFVKTLEQIPEISSVSVEAGDEAGVSLSDVERDILTGIRETIEIKILGLKESIQNFIRQSTDIIKKFSAEKDNVPVEEREAVLAGVRAAWLEAAPEENEIPKFFEGCFKGKVFATCRERVDKQVSLYIEILEKSAFYFKKEVLLYEVCTFEEILTHSVSRLRKSQNSVILASANIMHNTFRTLEVILKKNNIAVIRPAVKEQFNAKEHEVLMAEKADGFEKGEIIKVMTSGYRYKEQIILRVNVIAAR